SGRAGRSITASNDIPVKSCTSLLCIDDRRDQSGVICPQQLEVHEEERLILEKMSCAAFAKSRIPKRSTEAPAKDVLDELSLYRGHSDSLRIALCVESRRLVVLEQVAVKVVRA